MAFDRNNPPSLIASGIGGSRGLKAWAWKGSAPITEVLGAGYISIARKLGMGVGDSLRYVDLNNQPHHLVVESIDPTTGAGTIAFPDIAPESLEEAEPDFGDEAYVVAFHEGRQVRLSIASLIDLLGGVTGGGGGGGSGSPVAPSLPTAQSSNVPADYPEGAVVAFADPTNTPAPSPTWTMDEVDGLEIDSATGLVTIADRAVFFAALDAAVAAEDDITFVVTATNSAGTDTCSITLGKTEGLPVYDDIAVDNRACWFDAAYNPSMIINASNFLQEWGDRDRPLRKARNPVWPTRIPQRVGRGTIATQRPAVKFTPSGLAQYGLYFENDPLSIGPTFVSTLNGSIRFVADLKVGYSANLIQPNGVRSDGVINVTMIVTVQHEATGRIVVRANGVELEDTVWDSNTYEPEGDGIGFVVFRSVLQNGSYVFGQNSIGNQRIMTGPWEGEVAEIITFYNAVEAV
jgi:hypothetical protein